MSSHLPLKEKRSMDFNALINSKLYSKSRVSQLLHEGIWTVVNRVLPEFIFAEITENSQIQKKLMLVSLSLPYPKF